MNGGQTPVKPSFMTSPLHYKGERLGEKIKRPFQAFAAEQTSGGAVLLVASVFAIIWVNSPFEQYYHQLNHILLEIGYERILFEKDLHFWVNEGLMAIFFLVVGLEIKREVLVGELASRSRAALPIAAALGGMIVPAGIYLLFNGGGPYASGWGVPMATDIAFTLGALLVLGARISTSLKVFLVALAIVDDLGAVVVIALFYTSSISLHYLGLAAGVMGLLAIFNVLGFRRPLLYMLFALPLWFFIYKAGIHATVAGVVLALTIPARSKVDTDTFLTEANRIMDEFDCAGACGFSVYVNEDHQYAIQRMERMCNEVLPPLYKIEHMLGPWLAFAILPVFGLLNAGFNINPETLSQMVSMPVSLGIILGLFVGKPLGIFLSAMLAIKIGVAEPPSNTSTGELFGASILCGIGFTMSLFIGGLAFDAPEITDIYKSAIVVGSLLSGAVGLAALFLATAKKRSIPSIIG
jgi:NhaA family Na+:H+ antiporter